MEIEATECITENQSQQLIFQAEGYSSDKTLVNLQTLCNCDCNNNESINEQTDTCRRCSDNGEFKCGICECFPDYGGNCCNCKITSRDDYRKVAKFRFLLMNLFYWDVFDLFKPSLHSRFNLFDPI